MAAKIRSVVYRPNARWVGTGRSNAAATVEPAERANCANNLIVASMIDLALLIACRAAAWAISFHP
jgi:hypothetical protein